MDNKFNYLIKNSILCGFQWLIKESESEFLSETL